MQVTVYQYPSMSFTCNNLLIPTVALGGCYNCPHFTDEEADAQGG